MSTYTKKRLLSSVEKKAFAKKQEYTLSSIWEENKLTLMRKFLADNKSFDYGLTKIKEDIKITSLIISLKKKSLRRDKKVTIFFYERELSDLKYELSNAKTKKLQILEAEVFWRLFITYSSTYNGCFETINLDNKELNNSLIILIQKKTWQERFDILQNIKSSTDNPYLKITCDVLSIPPSVWKELLWRENIDFESYDSFLRRLKPEQSEAIEKISIEIFEDKKVPSIFNEDKLIRKLFKKIPSYDSLLEQSYNYSDKYITKGAFSYDLFNMDFGYGRYPNGINDDTEVVEKDLTKFISVKNHVNDFVVNKRDGIYWYLYQKIRSNYVYRPNREVTLSTHICPGFWYTIIMNLLFWIISPISVVILVINYNTIDSALSFVLLSTIASFTSIWLTLAMLKFLFLYFVQLFSDIYSDLSKKPELSYEQRLEKEQKNKKRKEKMEKISLILLKVIVFSLLAIFILSIEGLLLGSMLYLGFIPLNTIIVFGTINYLIWYMIIRKIDDDYIPLFKYWPKSLKVILLVTMYYIVTDIMIYFSSEIINFTTSLFFHSILSIFAFFYGMFKLLDYIEKKNESSDSLEGYKKISKVFTRVSILMYIMSILLIIYSLDIAIIGISIGLLVIIITIPIISIMLSNKLLTISPNAKKLEKNLNVDFSNRNLLKSKFSVLKNKYFVSLSKEAQLKFKQKIDEVDDYFEYEADLYNSYISPYELLNSSKKMNLYFGTYKQVVNISNNQPDRKNFIIKRWLKLISQDFNKKEILSLLNNEFRVLKKEQKQKVSKPIIDFKKMKKYFSDLFISFLDNSFKLLEKYKVFLMIGYIITFIVLVYTSIKLGLKWSILLIWNVITFLPKLFWKYSKQIWSVYQHFMNACPHVAEQKIMR